MYITFWQYQVAPEFRTEFLAYYRADGHWVSLFRNSPDFISTELWSDPLNENIFLTIDRWRTASAYTSFMANNSHRYAELDRICERFTTAEKHLAGYSVISEKH